MEYKRFLIASFTALILIISGCKKFLEIPIPVHETATEYVFASDNTANSAMIGILTLMTSSSANAGAGPYSISLYTGLLSDELRSHSASFDLFYKNELDPANNTSINGLWSNLYKWIYQANAIIEGVEKSTTLNPTLKRQLTGEAKFIRAFCHFYLLNFFGDVPIVTSTDYHVNNLMPRSSTTAVYKQIVEDLKSSVVLLDKGFIGGDGLTVSTERTRPSKWAAMALLARVYLYTKAYSDAEAMATSLINNQPQFALETDLEKVFLKGSTEAIWQLQPTANTNVWEGLNYILIGAPSDISLSSTLQNSFEANDQRGTKWVGNITVGSTKYYFPYKYKVRQPSATALTEYTMVLRLTEQYLIRAEARAELGSLAGAIDDLDLIKKRAGLALVKQTHPSIGQADLLKLIFEERRHEFFIEWGHRWFDLKRSGKVEGVMSAETPLKGGFWSNTDQLLPIPQTDRNNNPNLTQNEGYSQ